MKLKVSCLSLCILLTACQNGPGSVSLFVPKRLLSVDGKAFTIQPAASKSLTIPLQPSDSNGNNSPSLTPDLINTGGNLTHSTPTIGNNSNPQLSTNNDPFNPNPLIQRQNTGGASSDSDNPDPILPTPPEEVDPVFEDEGGGDDPILPAPAPEPSAPITIAGQCGSGTFIDGGGSTSTIPDPDNNCGQVFVSVPQDLGAHDDHVVIGVPITTVPNQPPPDPATVASFSPGSKISYTTLLNNKEEVFISDVDGSNAVNITNSSDNERRPIFSTDARYLTYSTDRMKRGFELFKISTDSRFLVRLTFDHLSATPYGWSAQNEVLFMNQGDLFVYSHLDGSIRQLQQGLSIASPTWSPNGNEIAFVLNGDIVSIDRLGNNFQTRIPNANVTGQISWASDNSHFVYEASGAIRTVPVIGGVSNLISNQQDSEPDWAPDSSKVVFTSRRTGRREVFTMNADGSNVSQLTSHGEESYHPNW